MPAVATTTLSVYAPPASGLPFLSVIIQLGREGNPLVTPFATKLEAEAFNRDMVDELCGDGRSQIYQTPGAAHPSSSSSTFLAVVLGSHLPVKAGVPGEGAKPPTHALQKRRSDAELPRREPDTSNVSNLQPKVE